MSKPFEVGKTYKNKMGEDIKIISDEALYASEAALVGIRTSVDPTDSGYSCVRFYYKENGICPGVQPGDLIPEEDTREVWVIPYYLKNDPAKNIYLGSIDMEQGEYPKDNRTVLLPKQKITVTIP